MARCPFAIWRGANQVNYSTQRITPRFIVIHVMQGSESGADAWFHDPRAIVSAHFGVAKSGLIEQYVDTNEEAYAEMAFNAVGISIEHEGYSGEHLTPAQLMADARLFEWAHRVHHIPLEWRRDAYGRGGVVSHGELGVSGGNHPHCPGLPIQDDVRNLLNKMHRPLFTISMAARH